MLPGTVRSHLAEHFSWLEPGKVNLPTSSKKCDTEITAQVGGPKGTQFAALLGEALLGAAQNALLLELQDQGPWIQGSDYLFFCRDRNYGLNSQVHG